MAIFIGLLVLVWGFCLLLQQSRKPSGSLGRLLMSFWNRVYGPMVNWCLNEGVGVKPQEVLDIGVGNGFSTKLLSKKLAPTMCIGIDYAPDAVKLARRHEGTGLKFQTADVTVLPFKAERFQLVTAFQTHFHWHDLNKGLAECYRVLETGGQLVIACERNKVAYYLKEQLDFQTAQQFFESFGFTDVVIKEERSWIAYYLQKR